MEEEALVQTHDGTDMASYRAPRGQHLESLGTLLDQALAREQPRPREVVLVSQRALLQRLSVKRGNCSTISVRDAQANLSFHVLLRDPGPELDDVLGTVQRSPPGTDKFAIVIGHTGIAKLRDKGIFELEPGQSEVCSIALKYRGTEVLDVDIRRDPAKLGPHGRCG